VGLKADIASSSSKVRSLEIKQKDTEKEQEDPLVLLDEVKTKRKKDKARLRDLGHEVQYRKMRMTATIWPTDLTGMLGVLLCRCVAINWT